MRTTHTYKPKYSHSTSVSFDQKKKDSRGKGYREILEAEEREWNAEEAVGEWGSISAKVMRTLESGQYQPETGRREMGLQGKFSFGQPGDRSRQGANHGGHQVVQPHWMMVQGRAQPLTGDAVTYGHGTWATRRQKENKTGLPDRLKAGIENLSGYSMDDVRVHYNSEKPAQLQAQAYAQGTEIHVGPGQEKHLPHEAWHVVQQKQGRVRGGLVELGETINGDLGLEQEAEVMGKRAWEGRICTREWRTRPANRQHPGQRGSVMGSSSPRAGDGDPIQCERANSLSVAHDLIGKNRAPQDIFEENTIKHFQTLRENLVSMGPIEKEKLVEKNRDYINYKKLCLDNINQIDVKKNVWNGDESNQLIFVRDMGEIPIMWRNREIDYKPHPTLIGGDPNVSAAGQLRVTQEKTIERVKVFDEEIEREIDKYVVWVNSSSGHFRFEEVQVMALQEIKRALNHEPSPEDMSRVEVKYADRSWQEKK
ncbi:DUF4157 domain-containing protein [Moorena producens JHB]|uniref:DUF4157 domain-containing protein n=1 Tax=Moorena producens (strain JHB) TaxID=1454205 RepID=A0A1D9G0A8_MOOP1|nr:DUF4157 domain-containing protein [Moorena producens]AOY81057.1 DUF4157 domain-containing protein [Moorena producens JHB]